MASKDANLKRLLPKEVTIKADSPDGPLSITIPVQQADPGTTLVHRLAARALIRDLELGISYLHEGGASTPKDSVVEGVSTF